MSDIKLHIGGTEASEGWTIVDIENRAEVDLISDASCLEKFDDNSVSMIYASHVLEHFHYGLDNRLAKTLAEWHRVLRADGELLISVPDLKTLCWLYLNPNFNVYERHHLMRIMFGGQMNQNDIHYVGLDFETLGLYLQDAEFSNYKQVSGFNLFNDCSNIMIENTSISLNIIAKK